MSPEVQDPEEEPAERVTPEEHEYQQDPERVLPEAGVPGPHRSRKQALDDGRSVEGWNRKKIERREDGVCPTDREDDLAGEVVCRDADLSEQQCGRDRQDDVHRWPRKTHQDALVTWVP